MDRLEISRAGLEHAGLYQCQADNGLGQVDSLNIQLVVLYAPLISLSHHWSLLEDSLVLELLCQVEADPPPLISWSRLGTSLSNSLDNVNIEDSQSFQQKVAGRLYSNCQAQLTCFDSFFIRRQCQCVSVRRE